MFKTLCQAGYRRGYKSYLAGHPYNKISVSFSIEQHYIGCLHEVKTAL